MQRICECGCGRSFETANSRRRFFGSTCRSRRAEGRASTSTEPTPPLGTAVATSLAKELAGLEVAESYEGQVALGIARQLDRGTVAGAAYASLSKELDRRVDALRLKAERSDDPAKVVKDRLAEKRAALAS